MFRRVITPRLAGFRVLSRPGARTLTQKPAGEPSTAGPAQPQASVVQQPKVPELTGTQGLLVRFPLLFPFSFFLFFFLSFFFFFSFFLFLFYLTFNSGKDSGPSKNVLLGCLRFFFFLSFFFFSFFLFFFLFFLSFSFLI